MRRDALKEVELVRFSRSSTSVSCKAAHTTVVAVAWEHQNCHGSPHSDPGSPCTKGRAIDVRGHHAAVRRSRAPIQTSHSSIDRVVARPLAANLLLQPCSTCMIWAESNLNHIKPSRAGRGRPASKTSCKALRQHSRRDEGECRRCPPSENEQRPLLKLLDQAFRCYRAPVNRVSPYRSTEYYTGTGIYHGRRHHDRSATAAPQLPVTQFVSSQDMAWRTSLNLVRLIVAEASGSQPPTHLGSTSHARHATGQCARRVTAECAMSVMVVRV